MFLYPLKSQLFSIYKLSISFNRPSVVKHYIKPHHKLSNYSTYYFLKEQIQTLYFKSTCPRCRENFSRHSLLRYRFESTTVYLNRTQRQNNYLPSTHVLISIQITENGLFFSHLLKETQSYLFSCFCNNVSFIQHFV